MSAALGVGDKAPSFSLARGDGGAVSLADFKGRKLALYFYPKADTSGCTREAMDFSRLKTAFGRAETDILGVSADPPRKLAAFSSKHGLTIALGSDETRKMIEAYGCWVKKSMYGRSYMGVARTTFLIGPSGRIARIWPKVKIDGHVEEVLAAAKAL